MKLVTGLLCLGAGIVGGLWGPAGDLHPVAPPFLCAVGFVLTMKALEAKLSGRYRPEEAIR